MKAGRRTLRTATWLTCSTLSLAALPLSAFSQTPPPADNPQAAQTQAGQEQQGRQTADLLAGDEDAVRQRRPGGDESPEVQQPKAWLGIGLKEISGDLAAYLGDTKGVFVESVFPDSPAEAAGVKVGDIITALDGQPVDGPRGLIEALLKFDRAHSQSAAQAGDQPQQEGEEKNEASQKDDDEKEGDADRQDKEQRDDGQAKKNAYPPVKLTILRRGEEKTIEVTPGTRPQSLPKNEVSAEFPVDINSGDLEEMLRQIESQGGARILRFGPPATLGESGAGTAEQRVENLVIVIRDANGKPTEVRIERVGDEPARISVTEEGKSRDITEDQIDQLPDAVRDAVRQALQRQQEAHAAAEADQADAAHRGLRGQPRQRLQDNRRLRDTMNFGPDELRQMGKSAEELAARYRKMAEEMGKRGMQKAQDLAALPDEVKALRAQVEELKKQLDEVQSQLKSKQQ